MEQLKQSIITEFDEETGEWEIADGQDDQLDGMVDALFADQPMSEADAIQQAIAEHVANK